jgi:hypothetical protein
MAILCESSTIKRPADKERWSKNLAAIDCPKITGIQTFFGVIAKK